MLFFLAGCASAPEPRADNAAVASPSFELDPSLLVGPMLPTTLAKQLSADPHSYFRALAKPFARRVCASFEDVRWDVPNTMVHGDAHLEQYVVTASSYGIEDFDHSGYGPAVIDLVRFGASLHLACQDRTWPCDANALVDGFIRAYRQGIEAPQGPLVAPTVVQRLRMRHPADPRQGFLTWAESLMEPLPEGEQSDVREAWRGFEEQMLQIHPTRQASYFDIVSVGLLRLGIGSAVEPKYLLRVTGPSESPADDVILEAKKYMPLEGIDCVTNPQAGGMLHVLIAWVQIGRRVPDDIGWVPQSNDGDRPTHFWVQSWDPGYVELDIDDFRDQHELEEVATDVGHQLGSSVMRATPELLKRQYQYAHLRGLELVEDRVRGLSAVLADEVLEAWKRYRVALAELPAGP